MSLYTDNESETNQWFSNMYQNINTNDHHNFEGSYFNCATAVARLSNERRKLLFSVFSELFESDIRVVPEDPSNEFSNRYISVDGDSLSVTSSGTRLFLGLMAALMDDRFTTVAIDEPELGLSPILQRKLAEIIIRGFRKSELLPHNPNIILSTHSHLFLDRLNPTNNMTVTKKENLIRATKCSGLTELQEIHFRLLGNELSDIFLPDAIMFVEGKTDKQYLEKIFSIHLPNSRVVVQECGGDIAKRLSYWVDSMGDMQVSPYRNRTFIVYDSVRQAGIERACAQAGIPPHGRIQWNGNGIEYVYPPEILAQIYMRSGITAEDLVIDGDSVSFGEITYKKNVLCEKVIERLTKMTVLPIELREKLLEPMASVVRPH